MKKLVAPVMAAVLAASMTVPAMAEYKVTYSGTANANKGVVETETNVTVKETETSKSTNTVKVTETATPTSSKIYVDGKLTGFDAYNIKGNNYFKLRDVAYALSGTENQFNVIWDAEVGEIKLISGEAYAKVGSLNKGSGVKKTATLNTAPIMKDNKYVVMTAYTIDGNNYFKLRDLGNQFGFTVGWNSLTNAVTIETAGYVPNLEAGLGGNGTVYNEGSQHSQPKAGDTVINSKGEKIVLQYGYGGVLGAGQGVDIWTNVVAPSGMVVKEGTMSVDYSTFLKDERTGEMHSHKDWAKIWKDTAPNNLVSDTDGEIYKTFWRWDADAFNPNTNKNTGYWEWIGPDFSA